MPRWAVQAAGPALSATKKARPEPGCLKSVMVGVSKTEKTGYSPLPWLTKTERPGRLRR